MYHLAEIINFAWEMDTGKEKDFSFMGAQFSHDLWLLVLFKLDGMKMMPIIVYATS